MDGNETTARDASWVAFSDAPLHPEYPSAHSILTAAGGTVLEAERGEGPVPALPTRSLIAKGAPRRWTSVAACVPEVAAARVYAGIHYRTSAEVGPAMGRKIGELAAIRFLGRPALWAGAPGGAVAQSPAGGTRETTM